MTARETRGTDPVEMLQLRSQKSEHLCCVPSLSAYSLKVLRNVSDRTCSCESVLILKTASPELLLVVAVVALSDIFSKLL